MNDNKFKVDELSAEDKIKDEFGKKILTQFSDEAELLDSTLVEIQELYDSNYEHFKKIKNSYNSGSLRFISDQLKNLISLKELQLSLIRDKTNMKTKITDIYFKDKNSNNNNVNNIADILESLKQLGNNSSLPLEETLDNEDDLDDDILLNERLEELISEGKINQDLINLSSNTVKNIIEMDNISESEEDLPEVDENGIEFIFDEYGTIYALDNEGDILEGYICPDIEVEFYQDEESEEIYALDKNDKKYRVLSLEDEEENEE